MPGSASTPAGGVQRVAVPGPLWRSLARDYKGLPETLVGLHLVAFTILPLRRATELAPRA
jgi:hypothetical protein